MVTAWCPQKDVTWLYPVYCNVMELAVLLCCGLKAAAAQHVVPSLDLGEGNTICLLPIRLLEDLMSFEERYFRGRMCAAKIKLGLG